MQKQKKDREVNHMRFNRTKRALAALLAVLTLLSVFGLSGPLGLVREADAASTAKVYNWSQGDSRWKKYTGISWGSACAVVAIAVQIARTDLVMVDESASTINTNTMGGFNPASFAKLAKEKGAVTSSSSVSWGKVNKAIPGFNHTTDNHWNQNPTSFSYFPAKSQQNIVDAMAYYLSKGFYPIVEGPGSKWASGGRHYVAVIKTTSNDVRVIDPVDGKEKSLFSVSPGGNKWTYSNIEKCGKPSGYGCCILYKVDASKLITQGAYLDLNGMLDGSSANNIEGFGTADVYINGTLVENDCTDYYAKWPAGTRYEIKDIRAKSGKVYAGVYSGSVSGTIQTSRINVVLSFNTAKTPTVYFNANGGSVNTSGKTVTVGSTYGTLPTPTRTGYAFDGWYTSASGGSKVTSSTTVSNSSNHTLYAHWNLVYYTVYFNANGGSVSPSSVSIGHGRTYGTLPTPSRTGYAFDGWYTSASGGSKVTSGSTVTYGHTLYAHWSARLNGWQTANNQTYYYRDGIKVTGWQKIDGRWFYFNSSGAMLKGWQQIGGKWYYFIVQGSVGQSGTMLTGWQHLSGGKTFYFNSSGAMQTGWQKIDGKWYYFLVQGKAGQSGTMLTGWQKLSNKWFYFNSSGVMQTGWQKIGGKWYYFLVQGKAGQSGTMLTGWQKLSNKWYYFNASGVMLTGRQKIDGKWYRFDTSGRLLP